MQIPLQITFRNLARSEAIESAIRERAGKLETVHHAVQSCRVVVEGDGLHKQHGRTYNVRIDLHVPNHEFAVTREGDEDVYVAVRDAFQAARRRLEELSAVTRGKVKHHASDDRAPGAEE